MRRRKPMQVGYARARSDELLQECGSSTFETMIVDRNSNFPAKIWQRGICAFELLCQMDGSQKDHEWFYLLNNAGYREWVIDIEMTKSGLLLTLETASVERPIEQPDQVLRKRCSFFR